MQRDWEIPMHAHTCVRTYVCTQVHVRVRRARAHTHTHSLTRTRVRTHKCMHVVLVTCCATPDTSTTCVLHKCILKKKRVYAVCIVQWDTGIVHPYPTGVLGRFYLALHPMVNAADVKRADTDETQAHAAPDGSIPGRPPSESAPGSEAAGRQAKSKKDKSAKQTGDAKASSDEQQKTQDIPSSDKKRKIAKDISITISSSNNSL
jgi:hypothetical protein